MELLLSKIESRVAGAWELKNDLDQLRDSLPSVNYLMEKAEWWRFKNPNIARLLVQLQDAAYDAEDVIAEFDYYELHQRIAGQVIILCFEMNGTHICQIFQSVHTERSQTPTINPNDNKSTLVILHFLYQESCNNSASKVKDVYAKLNSIRANLEREIGPLGLPDGPNPYGRAVQRLTSSINYEKVFGRENELEMVVKLMMQGDWVECSSNYVLSDSLVGSGKRKRADNISILPIVGGGGVGKTTLAELIYNDARVKNYFDLRIWVCVSDYFDLKRVTREMIESANIELSKKGELINNERQLNFVDSVTSLESLQQTLLGKVESKRCLIVLDDIWHEQSIDFEILCNPLRSGLQGSMILITTRLRNVVELVGTLDPIELSGLPDNIYWDLFKRCAFGSLDPSSFPELEDIGKKIAGRLKGSPLAAKTLGGILHVNMTTRQWRNILTSELWQIEQADGDILPALRVSYQYLPIHLKRCFLICSLFPKDYHLKVNRLSPIWMEDSIIPHHEKFIFNYEDNKGEAYFSDLQSRSFILSGQGRFGLHDHMHDLAKSLSRDTCYCQEDNKWCLENHISIRHLSVYHKPIELINMEIGKCKKLRSLLFLDGFNSEIKLGPSTLASLFDQLPYLRVLDLEKCQIQELPDNIGKFKLLFYINLRCTKIRSLPEPICQLYNLQVVYVDYCPLESFPKMFHNLINLRLITEMMEISSLIPRIGKLTSLEKLPEFKVLKKEGHKVEELKNMTRLRGDVEISNLENVESCGDASKACLNNKEYLTSLTLSWSPDRLEDTVKDESIIEGLEPHSNLENLHIKNYGGVTPASWLQVGKVSCLQELSIGGCLNVESLEDWFVQHQLLSLRVLEIYDCVKLALLPFEWIASSSLSSLEIRNCPLLSCPNNLFLPRSLACLIIDSCGELDKSFPRCLEQVHSLYKLELHNCHYVTSLLSLSNHLEELELTNCAELQYLKLSNPSILKFLDIRKCPKLMQYDPLRADNNAPTERIEHLSELHIDNTSLLELPFLLCPPRSLDFFIVTGSPEEKMFIEVVQGWLSGPENLKQLVFGDCFNLESLPEELHTLETVEAMQITNCPKIQSLPENGLPPSLMRLAFDGCHPTLIEQLKQHIKYSRSIVEQKVISFSKSDCSSSNWDLVNQ